MEMRLAALIEAIFVIMGTPDTTVRQCPLALDKWLDLIVGSRKAIDKATNKIKAIFSVTVSPIATEYLGCEINVAENYSCGWIGQSDLYKNRVQISLRGFVVIKNLFPTKQLGFLFGSFCISKYIPTSIKGFFVKLNSLHSLTMICIFTIMIKRMKFIDVVGHYIFLIVHCQETSMTK